MTIPRDSGAITMPGSLAVTGAVTAASPTFTGTAKFDTISGDNSTTGLTLYGGLSDGANLELYGATHATNPSNAYMDVSNFYVRSVAGVTRAVFAVNSTVLYSPVGGQMLNIRDSGGVTSAANPFIGFQDSAGTRLGYVGQGSTGNGTTYLNSDLGDVSIQAASGFSVTVNRNLNVTSTESKPFGVNGNNTSLSRVLFDNTAGSGNRQTDLHVSAQAGEDVYFGINYGGAAGSYIDDRTTGDFVIKQTGTTAATFASNGDLTITGNLVSADSFAPTASPTFTGTVSMAGQIANIASAGTSYVARSTAASASIELHGDTAAFIDMSLDGTGATDYGVRLRYLSDYLSIDGVTSIQINNVEWSTTDIANHDTAFGWGDHSVAGYLSAIPATDSPATATELSASQDLNDLNAGEAGFYYQTSNADTTGNNYPDGNAGSLLVQNSASNSTQLYITYPEANNKMWFRSYYTTAYGCCVADYHWCKDVLRKHKFLCWY
jgi:hypothetical protein